MKELTFDEVLRIAGGVPPASALDELTYRTSEDSRRDTIDGARLAVSLSASREDE